MRAEKLDIVVVGGGIIGCTAAYYLTRHPAFDPEYHSVTLLEATRIAGGASGKAGGLIAQWAYPGSIVPLSFDLHRDLAEAHNGVQQWGYRRIRCGKLTARDRKLSSLGKGAPWTQIASWISLGKRKNQESKALPVADLPKDLDWFCPNCIESYEDISDTSDTAQVNPYQFTIAMINLAEEAGVKVIMGSVDKINYARSDAQPSTGRLTTDGAAQAPGGRSEKRVESVTYIEKATSESRSIPATTVVLAAGPWTPILFPSAPVSALRAHSVTIRPAGPVSAYCLFTEISVPKPPEPDDESSEDGSSPTSEEQESTRIMSPEIYSRPNNEVYVCGAGDNALPLPPSTDDVEVSREICQSIVTAVSGISTELRDGVVTGRRACYLPTIDVGSSGGPLIGETGVSGLLLATGHSCWGIHNAPATGKLISEIIFDGEAISADIRGLDPRLVL